MKTINAITPADLAEKMYTASVNAEPYNGHGWAFTKGALASFSPDKGPWQCWEALDLGPNPNLPLNITTTESSVVRIQDRWNRFSSRFSLTDLFTWMHGLQRNPHYTVLGGSLGIPGSQAWKFISAMPGKPWVADFESVRRAIIAEEYKHIVVGAHPNADGSEAFEGDDIKSGKIIDPRLRDHAAKETNMHITTKTANVLRSGRDAVMTWAAQAFYPEQIQAFREYCAEAKKTLTCKLVAGTQSIHKTLADAARHGRETGEIMHARQIVGTLAAFASSFDQIASAADTIELYNTDGPKPILIARKSSRNDPMEILRPDLYKEFLSQKDLSLETIRAQKNTARPEASPT